MSKKIPEKNITYILPPKPNMEKSNNGNNDDTDFILTAEIAKAKGVIAMTNTTEPYLEMLSTISDNDVSRLSILLSIADDKDLNLGNNEKGFEKDNFLHNFVYHELKLNNSVPVKKGGIRSQQLLELLKEHLIETKEGVFSKLKSRF